MGGALELQQQQQAAARQRLRYDEVEKGELESRMQRQALALQGTERERATRDDLLQAKEQNVELQNEINALEATRIAMNVEVQSTKAALQASLQYHEYKDAVIRGKDEVIEIKNDQLLRLENELRYVKGILNRALAPAPLSGLGRYTSPSKHVVSNTYPAPSSLNLQSRTICNIVTMSLSEPLKSG